MDTNHSNDSNNSKKINSNRTLAIDDILRHWFWIIHTCYSLFFPSKAASHEQSHCYSPIFSQTRVTILSGVRRIERHTGTCMWSNKGVQRRHLFLYTLSVQFGQCRRWWCRWDENAGIVRVLGRFPSACQPNWWFPGGKEMTTPVCVRQRIRQLDRQGLTHKEISQRLGVSVSVQ